MSGQHCENYDVKLETVRCYTRNVDRCHTSFENNVIICFPRFDPFSLLHNKSLNDWSLGEQWLFFSLESQCFPRLRSGNIEILGKQSSLFFSGPVIECLLFFALYDGQLGRIEWANYSAVLNILQVCALFWLLLDGSGVCQSKSVLWIKRDWLSYEYRGCEFTVFAMTLRNELNTVSFHLPAIPYSGCLVNPNRE